MRTARYDDDGVQILDVPVPEPGRDEALVHISAAGVCHSDLHIARGEWAGLLPGVPRWTRPTNR